VLAKLATAWSADATYSHGFVVIPGALFLAWRRRDALRSTPALPSASGLAIVAASLALLAAGSLGAELFSTRISFIGVIAGSIVYAFGWPRLRVVAFPVVLLLLMIPLPAIVFDRVAVSLQLLASRMGEQLLQAGGVPVLRDGNILRLTNVTLEVNDACSGVRSLIALAGTAAAVLPIAVGLNGVRIALTGLAARQFGPDAARGAVHAASGWAVFVVALACMWALLQAPRMETA
jgi:exosortase